jgi:hypothetical protein
VFDSLIVLTFFTFLSTHLVRFILSCNFMLCLSSSSVCRIPLSNFCSAGLMVLNPFSYCLSWVFISPSIMKDSFAGYGNLGWLLFSFRAWNTSFYALLAFRVSIEKFAVILMSLPLYATCYFFFEFFNIFSLCLY